MNQQSPVSLKFNYIQNNLKLNWTFRKNTIIDQSFRHIFLNVSQNSTHFKQLISRYIKIISLGNYIGLVSKEKQNKIIWKQKSRMLDLTQISDTYFQRTSPNILFELINNLKQYKGQQIIIFIVVKQQKIIDKIYQITSKLRQKYKVGYIIQIVGNFQNKINQYLGINYINSDLVNDQFVKYFLRNIVARKMLVQIQCKNGQISPFNSKNWKSIDFDKISKLYYGTSIGSIQENIQIINLKKLIKCQLIIHLDFILTNGSRFKCSKKITIQSKIETYRSNSLQNIAKNHELKCQKQFIFEREQQNAIFYFREY